jgi:antitoxin Phd
VKNNVPRYVLVDYSLFQQSAIADETDVETAAVKLLGKYLKAFEELAK